jgi:tRNA pseudouridine38-40 synthase
MKMERNIRLLLAYDGTNYAGWQRQKDQPTIQGALEEKIAVITGHPAVLHGAGRTDAGVHALGMVANFATDTFIPCPGFRKGLNSMLPEDIRVLAVTEAATGFHSRFHATGKCYFYNLIIGEVLVPTDRLYCANLRSPLLWDKLQACLELLVGLHDFTSFEAAGSRDPGGDGMGAVREIHKAELRQDDRHPEKFKIVISGNGFLRHMVRNIVGTLVEVGKGKRSVAEFRDLIELRDRAAAGPTMPAKGLFLKEVYY